MTFKRRSAYLRGPFWSEEETNTLIEYLKNKRFSIKELLDLFPNRSKASIRSKTRKIRIKYDIFGESYRDVKMQFTEKHAINIKPENVFEAYCGAGHQSVVWSKYCQKLYSSDKAVIKKKQFFDTFKVTREVKNKAGWFNFQRNGSQISFFQGDVIDAAVNIKSKGIEIDVLDLDTCGSTLPVLPLLLNILKPQYLLITHGEFHSLRFRRDDVLRRVLFHRNINDTTLKLTIDDLAEELDKAVKIAALRSHNETRDSLWAQLVDQVWLGGKKGMLRRIYKLEKAAATSDCLNEILDKT